MEHRRLGWLLIVFLAVCSKEVNGGYTSPVYVWPLGQGIGNSEVLTGSLQPVTTATGVGVETRHASMDYEALYFNGESGSFVDLTVPSTLALSTDTAFMSLVYLYSNAQGVLFHFKRQDQDSDSTIDELKLYLENGFLSVMMVANDVDDSSIDDTSFTEHNLISVSTEQWYQIALSVDISNGRYTLFVDGSKVDLVNRGPINAAYGLPAAIRMGASVDDGTTAVLTGRITCFQIIPARYDTKDMSTYLQECPTANWNFQQITGFCMAPCATGTGKYKLSAQQQIPTAAPTQVFMARSTISCAEICTRESSCASFNVKKLTGLCKLYDQLHVAASLTSADNDSLYYVRTDTKCCL